MTLREFTALHALAVAERDQGRPYVTAHDVAMFAGAPSGRCLSTPLRALHHRGLVAAQLSMLGTTYAWTPTAQGREVLAR